MEKFCKSCGMPMDKDPELGGTNADGSKSIKYCSYCYHNGAFKFVGTLKEFQEHCRKEMIKSGHHPIVAWFYTRFIKGVERWKNT